MVCLYLAGKIAKNDWRHDVVRGLHTAGDWAQNYGGGERADWPVLKEAILGRFDYVGPYFVADDHGCGHGANTHGAGIDRHGIDGVGDPPAAWDVSGRCLDAIEKADILFAWVDSLDAYGTIAEIGYARALGKTVWLSGPESLPDLWFVYQLGLNCAPRGSAKETLRHLLDCHYPDHNFDSPIERDFWETWRIVAGDIQLQPQHRLFGGRYRLDFAHIETLTAIELDGYESHGSRAAFTKDRQRQREIERLGWRFIRFSGAEINGGVLACVEEAAQMIRDRLT